VGFCGVCAWDMCFARWPEPMPKGGFERGRIVSCSPVQRVLSRLRLSFLHVLCRPLKSVLSCPVRELGVSWGAARRRACTGEERAPVKLSAWQERRQALAARRQQHTLRYRFRRDPAASLAKLEADASS